MSRLGNAQVYTVAKQETEQNCEGCSGHNRKCHTMCIRESAYLSFTRFQPVTALTNPLCFIYWDGNCMGRGPLSKAYTRSINQEAPYLLRVRQWSIFWQRKKSVNPSHIISKLTFHVRNGEIGFMALEDMTDRSSRNVVEFTLNLTFVGPCIVKISQYIFNKMQRYTVYFIWKLLYVFRVVPSPIIRSANCIYSCLRSWWWVEVPPETCRAVSK